MSTIKFGTDGWRAVIAEEFTFDNLKIVVQGIANFIKMKNLSKKGVVIAFDHRFLAERFAEKTAQVLLGNGIRVNMFKSATPTPVAAFAIRHLQAGGAIMITASHNPPEYNGIKFIPEYAGPALPQITDAIEAEIQKVLTSHRTYDLDLQEGRDLGLLVDIDLKNEYIKELSRLVKAAYIKNRPLKVVVNPMFGAGCGYLDTILEGFGCQVKAINNHRDPLFGGSMPEPTSRLLQDLREEVLMSGADLGLALDGDADRFGIIDNAGNFISPNHFGSLLLEHLLNTREYRGPVARSVATTHTLDRVADRNDISLIETPVGFKYIGQAMAEKGCLLGIEESGGLSIFGHVPEKDGILACCLAVEMLAFARRNMAEISMDFYQKYGRLYSQRTDIKVSQERKPIMMDELKQFKPHMIAGLKLLYSSEMDGRKIVLENGDWILIRPSGTEPLFRLYIESSEESRMEQMQNEVLGALGLGI